MADSRPTSNCSPKAKKEMSRINGKINQNKSFFRKRGWSGAEGGLPRDSIKKEIVVVSLVGVVGEEFLKLGFISLSW
jgi:hypothetical protein